MLEVDQSIEISIHDLHESLVGNIWAWMACTDQVSNALENKTCFSCQEVERNHKSILDSFLLVLHARQ